MLSDYTVGVQLALRDLVSAPLARISQKFKAMDEILVGINASLKGIGVESQGIRDLGKAAGNLERKLSGANLQSERLEKNLAAIKALGMGAAPVDPVIIPRGNGGGGRNGGRYHNGGMHVGPNGVGLSAASIGLGDAAIPLAVGAAAAYGAYKFYDAAKDYQTEVARLTLFGLDKAQMATAEQYIQNLKTRGTSQAENMRFFTEAQGVFRESGLGGEDALTGAKLAVPMLAKIAFATKALDDMSKARMRTSSMGMLRFIEQMGGVKDPKTFSKYAEGGWKAIRSSGGVVDWEQYRQFAARAGIAGQYIDPDQLFGGLEPIIGELKGSTAGFSMRTAYNRIGGITKIPNQVAHLLADSGIWNKSSIEWNSQGGIKRFNGNPLSEKLNEMFLRRPVDFYEKTIIPLYGKMNQGKGLSQEERGRYNAMIFGSTGGNLFNKIDQQLPTVHKSMEAYKRTLGIDASVGVTGKTAAGAEADFSAAWTDFKKVYGDAILPKITSMIVSLTSLFKALSTFKSNFGSISDAIDKMTNMNNPLGLVDKANSVVNWAKSKISNPAPVIHNHFKVDSKEITHHIIGGANQTGPIGVNPSHDKLWPGTGALGF